MRYATWNLNFDDPRYGTGPEQEIANLGGWAECAIVNGDVTQGAIILGYFDGQVSGLDKWDFQEVTESKALAFALGLNADCFLMENGKIGVAEDE